MAKWTAIARRGVPPLIGAVVGLFVGLSLGGRFEGASRKWQYDGKPLEYWVHALGTSSVETRTRAAYALGEADTLPAIGCFVLVEHLRDDAEVREEVRRTLIRWARTGRCIQETAATLSREVSTEVRRLATDVLRGAGPQARPVAGALEAALGDPVPSIRALAAVALGGSGDTSATVQRALALAVSDPDADVRANAIESLAGLPSSSPRLIRVARRGASDPDPTVRAAAMQALGHVETIPGDLTALLVHGLSDSATEVRAAAATSLGWMHGGLAEARPALKRAAVDADARVRNAALLSLLRLANDSVR